MIRLLLWGSIGGVLLVVLRLVEYEHYVRTYPSAAYGGVLAAIFSALGLYLGRRWARARAVVVVREVFVPAGAPFVPDAAALEEVGLTPREHEILGLIAEGLTNRQIGERIFVSENTVKTHAYRLFDKLGVDRRVQAVRRGRELRLIP